MKLLTIKSRQDFVKIQKNFDKRIHSENYIILLKKTDDFYIQKNGDLTFCRFAVVVTKKISKLAVVRNKIKRTTKEIVRNINRENDNLFFKEMDYEIIVKKEIAKAKFNVLYNEIKSVLIAQQNSK